MFLFAHAEGGHGSFLQPWEIHPALTHFPIAFLLGGVALDLYAWWRSRPDLVPVATGLLIGGLLTGVITALAGVLAFLTVPAHTEEAHQLLSWHIAIQTVALLIFACPAWERWRYGSAAPSLAGRLAGCLAAGLLVVGSAIGGYIVYHGGAGIHPELLAPDVREHQHGPTQNQPKAEHYIGHQDEPGEDPAKADNHEHGTQDHGPAKKEQDKGMKPPDAHAAHQQESKTKKASDEHKEHAQKDKEHKHEHAMKEPSPQEESAKKALLTLPPVPPASASAAYVPPGYYVQVVLYNLSYPSSLAFDDAGNLYIAEAGEARGGPKTLPRVIRVRLAGEVETVVSEGLEAPVTNIRWYEGRLYISHRGKISAWSEKDGRVDLTTGLAGMGVDYNRQMSIVGPDGKLYLAQGSRLLRVDPKTNKAKTFLGRMGEQGAGMEHASKTDHKNHGTTPKKNEHQEHSHKDHAASSKPNQEHAKKHEMPANGMRTQPVVEDAASAGPRRLVDMRLSPRGDALYVLDFGAVFMTADGPRPVPGTGVLWRILPDEAAAPVLLP